MCRCQDDSSRWNHPPSPHCEREWSKLTSHEQTYENFAGKQLLRWPMRWSLYYHPDLNQADGHWRPRWCMHATKGKTLLFRAMFLDREDNSSSLSFPWPNIAFTNGFQFLSQMFYHVSSHGIGRGAKCKRFIPCWHDHFHFGFFTFSILHRHGITDFILSFLRRDCISIWDWTLSFWLFGGSLQSSLFCNWSWWTGLVHFCLIWRMRKNQHSLEWFNFDRRIFIRSWGVCTVTLNADPKSLIKSVAFRIFVAHLAHTRLQESTLFLEVNPSSPTNSVSLLFGLCRIWEFWTSSQ